MENKKSVKKIIDSKKIKSEKKIVALDSKSNKIIDKKASKKDFSETKITLTSETILKVEELNKIFVDILNNTKTVEHFKNNLEFRNLVARLLAIYNKYANNNEIDFKKKYENISPGFSIDEINNIPVTDIDVVDEIKYLDLYFKNVFKYSVYELSRINSASFNATQILNEDSLPKIDNETSTNSNTLNFDQNSAASLFGEFERKQRFLSTLSEEQRKKYWRFNPEFYPYESKPKSIVISKIFLIALLAVIIAIHIMEFVLLIINFDKKIILETITKPDGNQASITLDIWAIAFSIFSLFIVLRITMNLPVGWKYDKNKYYLRLPPFTGMSVIFYFMFNFVSSKWRLVVNINKIVTDNPDNALTLRMQWLAIIINMALVAFAVAFYIIATTQFNPRMDKEKIRKAEEEFFREVPKQ